MNKYQKIAFTAPAVLAVAFLIAHVYGIYGLGLSIVVTLIIALLTLSIVRSAIYGLLQLIASTIAFIGHGVGKLGDIVADFAFTRRQRLSPATNKVPDWDTLVTQDTDESRTSLSVFEPHPVS